MRGPHAARSHLHARARPRDSSPLPLLVPQSCIQHVYSNADALSFAYPQVRCNGLNERQADAPNPAGAGGQRANDEVSDGSNQPLFPRNSPPASLSCCGRVWSCAGSRRSRSTSPPTSPAAHGTQSGLLSALCACVRVCRTTHVLRLPASQHSVALRARKLRGPRFDQ